MIDIHSHSILYHDPAQRANPAFIKFMSPAELVAVWDDLGIDRGVVLPISNHENDFVLQTTENVLDMAALYPDRIIPFCNIDPRQKGNSEKTDFGPLLEHYKALGCKGVGEMSCNLWWDDPLVLNMLGHIEAAGLPMTFHIATRDHDAYGLVDEVGLPRLEKVLGMFPKLNFLAHSQPFWAHISADVSEANWGGYPSGPVQEGRVVELMRRYDNLWGDMSAGSGLNAITRDPEFGYRFLEEFQDRLLFGTDVCAPGELYGNIVRTFGTMASEGNISQTVYDKVTHGNVVRLLGL
ncbi:MAG: amidohydrolase family protein [Armatimonadia bacterium]